jgi:hypothetical protein
MWLETGAFQWRVAQANLSHSQAEHDTLVFDPAPAIFLRINDHERVTVVAPLFDHLSHRS